MAEAVKERLGTARLVARSFALFFERFTLFIGGLLISALFLAIIGGVSFAIFDGGLMAMFTQMMAMFTQMQAMDIDETMNPAAMFSRMGAAYLGLMLLMSIVLTFVVLLMSHVWKDARDGRPARYSYYLKRTFQRFLPAFGATIALQVLFTIAQLAGTAVLGALENTLPPATMPYLVAISLVTYLWLMAAFVPFSPILALENISFGAIARSFRLTRGYRWKILLGLLLLLVIGIICIALFMAVGGLLIALVMGTGIVLTLGGALLTLLSFMAYGALFSAFLGYAVLIYFRLREVKEGGTEDVADVFS